MQRHERDEVRKHHQAVEEVGERPNEVDLEHGARDDEGADDHAIGQHAAGPEEEAHVLFAEEVPAHDGGEGEEEEADGDEGHAEGAQAHRVGVLRELDTRRLEVEHARHKDDDAREGHDHDRRKDAEHRDEALFGGMLDASDGMRVRGRAHTGLVREEAAGHAELHRLGDRQAERAAHDGLGIKGRDEDEPEGGNHFGDVGADHPEAADEVDGRHEGNDLLGDTRQTADAAEEDEAREHRAHDARDGGRHVEGGLHGVRDGVGLHHVADAAQRNDDCDREEDRKRTPLLAHAERDVVGGTAEHAALLVLRAIGLREHGFGEDGCHAEEGRDPEPEERARTARHEGRGRARNVARAHLGRNGRGKRLKGAHARLVGTLAEERRSAQKEAGRKTELAHLNEAQLDGVEDARAAKQRNQEEDAPEDAIDVADELIEEIHL